MVGIVVVSHSRPLARAAVSLASEMIRDRRVRIAIAAGLDETTTGTDAVAVADAIMAVDGPDGVVVLLDLGSAVLSAELALELLPDDTRARVVLSAAPLIEGLITAVVTAAGGANATEVAAEAVNALADKRSHLGVDEADAPAAHGPSSSAAAAAAAAPAPAATGVGVDGAETGELVVDLPHGLHARPAARVVSTVREFDAAVTLSRPDGQPVPAGSLSRIAALGVRAGERVLIRATGRQAVEAVAALYALAGRRFDESPAETRDAVAREPTGRSGTGIAPTDATPTPAPTGAAATPAAVPSRGPLTVLAGLALAPAARLGAVEVRVPDTEPGTTRERTDRLRAAVAAVAADLRSTFARTRDGAGSAAASIFSAHLALLEDPEIVEVAYAGVAAGNGPAAAWDAAVRTAEQGLSRLDDDYLRARAADVRAVGDAVLVALLGAPAHTASTPGAAGSGQGDQAAPAGIVLAADLTPSQAALLDPARVLGVVLAGGSPTAHAAILVRSLGIPMLVGAGPDILTIAAGTPLALDAGAGTLTVDPDEATVTDLRARIAADAHRSRALRAAAAAPAVTSDGTPVEVTANVGSVTDATLAAAAGADGSGLVRTEFCFTGRSAAPGAGEQEGVYEDIAAALHPHRVVFRTMDVGGDKPLAFVAMPTEANPFLGVRGLRISLLRRDLLRDQLTAILAVARRHPVSVMFPMVTTVEEVLSARAVLDEVAAATGGLPEGLRVGMMVEVPGAAVKAASFAPHVDFFSVGTNDLTQYTLAAERGNEALTGLADALDPGVLGLISLVCRGAAARPGKPVHVAVCGEAAADPAAVAILLGLGVRELSVAAPAVASVKDRVRHTDIATAGRLAAAALTDPGAAAVRARVAAAAAAGAAAAADGTGSA